MNDEKLTSDLSIQEQKFKTRISELKAKVAKFTEKPNGHKFFPARTCSDIKAFYPTSKSGFYWIDPNRGCSLDAIQVHCNFTTFSDDSHQVTTCVYPTKQMSVEKKSWDSISPNNEKFFDEDHDLGKLEYNADLTQLKYLGLLSSDAYQNITIHCKKAQVWNSRNDKQYENAMRFKGMSEQIFAKSTKAIDRFQPETIKDDCQYMTDSWRETVLRFTSRKFIRLPIVDFAPIKLKTDAEYGITLGPVCFY